MTQEKANLLTVHPPIITRQLGRYRDVHCVFLIRDGEGKLLYVGKSKNAYKAVLRLFQKNGLLEHLDRRRLKFEMVLSKARLTTIERVFKIKLKPQYNYIAKYEDKTITVYQERQSKRIWASYLEQTRFDVPGEHRTDA